MELQLGVNDVVAAGCNLARFGVPNFVSCEFHRDSASAMPTTSVGNISCSTGHRGDCHLRVQWEYVRVSAQVNSRFVGLPVILVPGHPLPVNMLIT